MKIMRSIIIGITILMQSPIIYAVNPSFLHDITPISDFTKEDSEMFWNAITSALDTKKDGEKLAWKNDKSGNSGLVNPLSSFQEGDTQCRNLRIINRSQKHIAESKYKFCKREGKWVAIDIIKSD